MRFRRHESTSHEHRRHFGSLPRNPERCSCDWKKSKLEGREIGLRHDSPDLCVKLEVGLETRLHGRDREPDELAMRRMLGDFMPETLRATRVPSCDVAERAMATVEGEAASIQSESPTAEHRAQLVSLESFLFIAQPPRRLEEPLEGHETRQHPLRV